MIAFTVGGVIELFPHPESPRSKSFDTGDSPTGQATDLPATCQERRAKYRGCMHHRWFVPFDQSVLNELIAEEFGLILGSYQIL
jgi:hypothetical protein